MLNILLVLLHHLLVVSATLFRGTLGSLDSLALKLLKNRCHLLYILITIDIRKIKKHAYDFAN